MSYKLQDLIDISLFQQLQDRLNSLHPFPSAIIDNDGKVLTATAWQDVCTVFHRGHPDCARDCVASDLYILSHLHEANPAITYTCPRGMVDSAIPIVINGVHYANFFTGQLFLAPPDLEFFHHQARVFGFDEEKYLEAVRRVPVWTPQQFEQMLVLIQSLLAVLTESAGRRLNELEAKARLKENESLIQHVLTRIFEAFWVVQDKDLTIVEANESICRLLGYAPEELIGKSVPVFDGDQSPEKIFEIAYTVQQEGYDFFETRLIRKDGSPIDVEVAVTYLPELHQFFAYHRDISGRKLTERALRESESRLSAIFNGSRDAIGVSKAGIHYLVNPAYLKLFGFQDASELIGTPISNLIAPECRQEVAENVRKRLLNEKAPDFYETTALRRDGSRFRMEVNVSTYILGKDVLTVVILRDVTERKQFEEAIRNSLEQKETLLRELYHRTKNNMQIITAMLELQAVNSYDANIQTMFREMENRIAAMALVHQKLYQTRDLSWISLSDYISDLMALLMSGFGAMAEQISVDLELEDIGVTIDTAIPCGLAVNEMVTNAVKYAFPNGRRGRLVVSLDLADADTVKLVFRDDGIGLPPDFDFRQQNSLGIRTIIALVEHQLSGQVMLSADSGTTWQLLFPRLLYEPRV